jgi:hypothetical protein
MAKSLRWSSLFAALLLCFAASAQTASAQQPAGPKPVPRMQVIPLPLAQAAVERDGQEISRYYFGGDLNRPFLFPLIGPSGRSLTRMGHPHDPNGHSHHNSVWVSHHKVGDVDFWGDTGKGRIVHKRVVRFDDADDEALIQVENAWVDQSQQQKPLLKEFRTLRFQTLSDGEWRLVIDLELSAAKDPVTLGQTPFGLVGVRMAKTIGVHDGGGSLRNSEGAAGEEAILWKQARWVDYSGPITREVAEGITLMDHPSNPNHPTHFHVRGDGWMGTSLTYGGERTITTGEPLKLRYGLWIHRGQPTAEEIDRQFARFADVGDPPASAKK